MIVISIMGRQKSPEELLGYQLNSEWMTAEEKARILSTYSTVEEQLAAAREWNSQAKASAGGSPKDLRTFAERFGWRIKYNGYTKIEQVYERVKLPGFQEGVIKHTMELTNEAEFFEGKLVYAFEKDDGSNHGIIFDPVTKMIYPRGRKESANDGFMFTEYFEQFSYEMLEKILSKYIEITDKPITLFLEFFGKGIQEPMGSKYDAVEKHCALFDIRLGNDDVHRNYCYYGYQKPDVVENVCKDLIAAGIKNLELPKRLPDMTLQMAIDLVRLGFRSFIFYKDGINIASDPSKWGQDEKDKPQQAEGIVLKYFDEDGWCHFVKVKTCNFREFDRAVKTGVSPAPDPDKYPSIETLKEKYKDYKDVIFI